MKIPLKPGHLMPKAALALCLLGACATTSFAQYPPSGQKPRVGTRFLNFVKDLVWGEEPENRYRGYAPPPQASTRQQSYGAQGAQRFNLDRPPVGAGQDEHEEYQRPVPPPPSQNHLSQQRDMPYTAPRKEKAPEPERQAQHREEAQEDPPAPVKQKPPVEERKVEETPPPSKGLFSKKSEPKQKVEESVPESKPDIQPLKTTTTKTETPKQEAPVETQKETVVASNKEKSTGGSTNSTAPASNGATLTGTRTTKAGLVKSPYAPYNELDVTGLPSGSLAMDPTTGKVFRVP
ncbi:MAG: hypothetical protein ACAH88_08170 [Roseimicrobium sp.]